MSTSYLWRHLLIPVLQNFRQRFSGLSVSDHGIVRFDIWSKCILYCVPSLGLAEWDILLVFCFFSIYFLKAWFLVEKVGFLVIIFSARKWREHRILHHLPQSFCRKADPLSGLRTHHFGLATPLTSILYINAGFFKTFNVAEIHIFKWSSSFHCIIL